MFILAMRVAVRLRAGFRVTKARELYPYGARFRERQVEEPGKVLPASSCKAHYASMPRPVRWVARPTGAFGLSTNAQIAALRFQEGQ